MSGSEPGNSSQPSFSNSLPHVSVASQQARPAPSNNRLTLVALGIAAAAGGAAALLYVGFARTPAASPAAASTVVTVTTSAPAPVSTPLTTQQPTAAPTGVADPAPKASKVLVKASPDTAEIFLDGKKVGEKGRYEGSLPDDGAEHELKVDAPGFASKTKTVKAGEDLTWEPELTPNRAVGATQTAKTAAPAEPTTPPPPPPPTSTGEKRDKNGRVIRPIETNYPGAGG